MFPIIPVFIGTLVVSAAFQAGNRDRRRGVMTPQRQAVFDTAINEVKDVDKLKAIAKVFRDEGLDSHAELLEKRIKLRELPPEIKAARKNTFRKAMSSTNPAAVRQVADIFENEGANGAANALRDYADALVKKAQEVPEPMPVFVKEEAKEETKAETKISSEDDEDENEDVSEGVEHDEAMVEMADDETMSEDLEENKDEEK